MGSAHNDKDTELYRKIQSGDAAARNMMAERHMGLVARTAEYYAKRNPHLDLDDLLQEGRIGIVVALDKFSVDKGFRFSTYATWWVKHYIQRYVVNGHSRVVSAKKKDTEAYLGERMSKDEAKLYEVRCISYLGLQGTSDTRWDALEEFLASDELPVEEVVEASINWQRIVVALLDCDMPERDKTVLCMRYGVLGYRRYNLAEIADEIGLTRQAVSAIEKRSVKLLQEILEGDHDGSK